MFSFQMAMKMGCSSNVCARALLITLRIQIWPKISGFPLYSYSGYGIETINPTIFGRGLVRVSKSNQPGNKIHDPKDPRFPSTPQVVQIKAWKVKARPTTIYNQEFASTYPTVFQGSLYHLVVDRFFFLTNKQLRVFQMLGISLNKNYCWWLMAQKGILLQMRLRWIPGCVHSWSWAPSTSGVICIISFTTSNLTDFYPLLKRHDF